MKLLYLYVFFLLVVPNPISSIAEEMRTYTTIGARSCKVWNDQKAEQQKVTAEINFSQFDLLTTRSWLLGYLSGYNALLSEEIDLLDDIDADTITLWMDNYCSKNPAKGLTDGARQLAKEIIKIHKRKPKSQ